MANYTLKYVTALESEHLMLDELTAILKKHQVKERLAQAVMLAVSEAFTNAAVHGHKLDSTKEIIVELIINDTEIHADILDNGSDGLDKIARRLPAKSMAEHGRGVDLIKHYADEVEFCSNVSGGLTVSMRFLIDAKSIEKTI